MNDSCALAWLLIGLWIAASPLSLRAQRGPGLRSDSSLPGTVIRPSSPTVPGNGVSREAIWPAPTTEDWRRPCLITWQRSFEDARAVSRATGRPILVCVNMDGEIASEHYAGIRYRQPQIAALYEPYVCVIASVYRHTPRDHDDDGRRILCPRFGSVTCGEHIAIEPGLYQRYFDGQRVAPRHIGVDLDSAELYDVLYAPDTDSVFAAIRNGIARSPAPPAAPPRGDLPLAARVASPDIRDRQAVERAYLDGDQDLRRALLDAAVAAGAEAPVELLRLALAGYNTQLSRRARTALTHSTSPAAIELIVEALSAPLAQGQREALIKALERLGETSPRARRLAVVQRGLSAGTDALDSEAWSRQLERSASEYASHGDPAFRLQAASKALLTQQDEVLSSTDGQAHVSLAEAFLAQAYELPDHERQDRDLLLRDALNTAGLARQLGADGWRAAAVSTIASYYLRDTEAAWRWSAAALGAGVPDDAADWNSMAVLAIFAQGRQQAIRKALQEHREWPGQWLADVHAACSLLALHPFGTDEQVIAHYEFLQALGAEQQAGQVLDAGLRRFPDSPGLHQKLRSRLLSGHGVEALEAAYSNWRGRGDSGTWYAGLASLVAAEFQRRTGQPKQALLAYERAMTLFEEDITAHPEERRSADEQIAMALAGEARVALEQGQLRQSVAWLLASFERQPEAAARLDGLNLSAVDTARMLRPRLSAARLDEPLERLNEALATLDPRLLRLPSYERPAVSHEAPLPWRRQLGPGQGR